MTYSGHWRRYQELALAAFERDRASGKRRTHIVAPPGSGKTLMGSEMVRRVGTPALILSPNSAIQSQWLKAFNVFSGSKGLVGPSTDFPVACLTYQSLAQLDDPAALLGDLAERRWVFERAQTTQQSLDAVYNEVATWAGEAAARREREVRRISANLKREIARSEHGKLHLGQLLSEGARERLEAMKRQGVETVILDECHHLASLWGYVVRAVIEELGDVHLIGLTATPPDGLSKDAQELYDALLGPVDFTVPTPAVVRERYLAPYQELAWFTSPLDSESQWLREHDIRFQDLITNLHSDSPGPLSFPEWVITRMRERGVTTGDGGEARVNWTQFQRRRPALARAGARFLASARLPLPDDVPRGEGYREQPNLADWLVLLEDYALRCLRAGETPEAAARYEGIAAALRELGYTLTRQGIRRGASDVDRLLTRSAAKPLALVEVIACEYDARGEGLRALVLCDSEQVSAPSEELRGVLTLDAGTAPDALKALAADLRTSILRPLLVSGRGLRCDPSDVNAVLQALRTEAPTLTDWDVQQDGELVRIEAKSPDWKPRFFVPLATRIFERGQVQVLVGTRSLLGEGWDAPSVNCVVDLTAATTSVSVTQMRGRSLRLDPNQPEKIASNWDVVCVEPELARGDADYQRFVRKHLHLFAPSEDGAIEAGPSHVHPALSPFEPPKTEEFAEINRTMAHRAQDHELARERWAIGTPYIGEEHQTLVVRPRVAGPVEARDVDQPPAYPVEQRPTYAAAGVAAAAAGVAVATGALGLAIFAAPAALLLVGFAAFRLTRVKRELAPVLPLDLAARAVCNAYVELGEMSPKTAKSLSIEPRASGYLRCYLKRATPEEAERFSQAMEDLVSPPPAPRYLVSRMLPGKRSALDLLGRSLLFRPPFEKAWSAVPQDLGRKKERAAVFHLAWQRWLGPAELRFTQRSEDGQQALAEANSQAADYEARTRLIWV
jgi:superfamily II DNA or RNA helicase